MKSLVPYRFGGEVARPAHPELSITTPPSRVTSGNESTGPRGPPGVASAQQQVAAIPSKSMTSALAPDGISASPSASAATILLIFLPMNDPFLSPFTIAPVGTRAFAPGTDVDGALSGVSRVRRLRKRYFNPS